MAAVQSFGGLVATRFCLGFVEAVYFVLSHPLILQFYPSPIPTYM